MSTRYWTLRAQDLAGRLEASLAGLDEDEAAAFLAASASEAVNARDPENLGAILRTADSRLGCSSEVRFSAAIHAMDRGYFDCACAAWDDGGGCWASTSEGSNVPDSRTSARVMLGVCEKMSRYQEQTEADLCRRMTMADMAT